MTTCILDHSQAPPADVGLLCAEHFSQLRSRLLELPAVARWLQVNIAAGGVVGERVSGSREDPIPLRLAALDLIGPVAPRDPTPPPVPLRRLVGDTRRSGAAAEARSASERTLDA